MFLFRLTRPRGTDPTVSFVMQKSVCKELTPNVSPERATQKQQGQQNIVYTQPREQWTLEHFVQHLPRHFQHTHTHTHTLHTQTHTLHTHSFSLSHTHPAHSLSLSLTHKYTPPAHSLSLTHTHTQAHTLPAHTHALSLSLSLSLSHTHTHTQSIAFKLFPAVANVPVLSQSWEQLEN